MNRHLSLALALVYLLCLLGPAPVKAAAFSCDNVTEIPQIECEALVALYNSTNGPGWTNKTNWLVTNTPGNWYGVTLFYGNVSKLTLIYNNLTGTLPVELGNLSMLSDLSLYGNKLSGNIPPQLGNLSNLVYLMLENNLLTGSIPVEVGNFSYLKGLHLSTNQLSGNIPSEIGNLTRLEYLDLYSNQFTGSIPTSLGNLTMLVRLYLYSNQLSGSIPKELGALSNLQELRLHYNQLSGNIPPELGNLSNLYELTFLHNQLTGNIPPELGQLSNLLGLSLGYNLLSGNIPDELGNLSSLGLLNLVNNPLSGSIPLSLTNLSHLSQFYFVNTELCEPSDPVFQVWKLTVPNWLGTNIACPIDDLISGKISLPNGDGLIGVTVSAGSGLIASTDSNGIYTFSNLADGQYTLTAAKEGYSFSPAWQTVSVPPGQNGVNFSAVLGNIPPPNPTDPPPAIEPGKPYVSDVSPCITGPYYFKPWLGSVDNSYTATINWQGLTPKSATFNLNGLPATQPVSGNTVTQTYNLNDDFLYENSAGNNISVVARDLTGFVSPVFRLRAFGVDLPPWLSVFTDMTLTVPPGCVKKPMKIEGSITFPNPPFEGMVVLPDWFPFIGDNPFGIKETQAGIELEFEGSGEGEATIFGQTGFEAAGNTITGKLSGTGKGTILPDDGINLDQGSLNFELAGKIEKEKPLVDLICKAFTGGACPLEELEGTPVLGSLVEWFNDIAIAKGEVEPSLNFGLNIKSGPSGLTWDSGTAVSSIRLKISLILEALEDILTAEVYGGGEPQATFQVPANPSYLKELALELFAGVKLKAFDFERAIESSYEWSYSPSKMPVNGLEWRSGTDSGWKTQSREYANQSTSYAVFQANRVPFKPQQMGILQTDEHLFASNVYPQGNPALVQSGSTTLLMWVHDDINQPVLQGKEIFFSQSSAGSWSTPTGVTQDQLQDFAPQAAVDGSGKVVLVWERNSIVQPATAQLDATYTNAFEIAWAVWDGSHWSTPQFLTNNSAFDHAPMLAQGTDGQITLVWRQNAGGELIGNALNPDTFYTTTWNGLNWSTPQVLRGDSANIMGIEIARFDANQMAVVYSQDVDGSLSTKNDQELFMLDWNGSTWSSPIQLTDDDQADAHPSLMYASDGSPRLLWMKGDQLTGLIGNLGGAPETIVIENSSTIMDYAAAQNLNDRMVLLWQGLSTEGVDIFYATYDEEQHLFSRVVQLTHDQPLEKFMAPLLDDAGNLLVAYNRTNLQETTIKLAKGQDVKGVVTFGQTDLYLLNHTFGADLEITNQDISLNETNPLPGTSIQLNVHLQNRGDIAVSQPSVTFYLGDPSAGGIALGTVQSPESLRGGDTVDLTLNYTLPASAAPFVIFARADATELVLEGNENNNQGFIAISLPDLIVSEITATRQSGQLIKLTALIQNIGVATAGPGLVSFRLDDPITGALLGESPVSNLNVGAQTSIDFTWDASSTPDGTYPVYAIIHPTGSTLDVDPENNFAWTGVSLLPDLHLQMDKLVTIRQLDGTLQINLWIQNIGLRPAENITVGGYARAPEIGSQPISFATTSIPPGEFRAVGINLGHYLWDGFYVGAGYDLGYQDENMGNNLIMVGQPPVSLFLPMVRR